MNVELINEWEDFNESRQINDVEAITKQQFSDFLSDREQLKNALLKPFEYLFADIIGPIPFNHDFKSQFIDHPTSYEIYDGLTDDAKACIALGNKMRNIPVSVFPNWLDNTLKVADHLVLYYIQNFKNASCIIYPNHGTETSRYKQIQEFDCKDIRTAGLKLKYVYENRNLHAHRTIIVNNKQVLIKVNRNKIRYNCIKEISIGYDRIHKAFSKAYPNYNFI